MWRMRNRNSTEDTGGNTLYGEQDIPCSHRCGVYRPNHTAGTGDEDMMMWYAGILAAALLAIVSVHLVRKRKDAALLSSVLYSPGRSEENTSQELPEQVRTYLGLALGPSAPRICNGAYASQSGKIRKTPASEWIHFTAEQTYSATRPAFAWVAHSKKLPLIIRDHYDMGKGMMQVRMGPFDISKASGPELDSASLLRFASEMVFVPQMMDSPAVTWKYVDAKKAIMIISDSGIETEMLCTFGEDNLIHAIEAKRHRIGKSGSELLTWGGTYSNYKRFHDVLVPTTMEGFWYLHDEKFIYVNITVNDVRYEVHK